MPGQFTAEEILKQLGGLDDVSKWALSFTRKPREFPLPAIGGRDDLYVTVQRFMPAEELELDDIATKPGVTGVQLNEEGQPILGHDSTMRMDTDSLGSWMYHCRKQITDYRLPFVDKSGNLQVRCRLESTKRPGEFDKDHDDESFRHIPAALRVLIKGMFDIMNGKTSTAAEVYEELGKGSGPSADDTSPAAAETP